MATVKLQLDPRTAIPGTANGAQHTVFDGTNFPVPALAFDGGSADEAVYFLFKAINYGSGNLTLTIDWYADTASTGNVVWGAQVAAITPNIDTQDIEAKAFAAANTQQDAHLGTIAQRLHSVDLVISNLDSIAADDWVALHLFRDASDTVNDTLAGDALVVMLTLSYSDT